MIFYGFAALLQVLFLPGFIFLSLLDYKKGFIRTSILSIGLSLSINYLFVLALLSLHLYKHFNVCCFFLLEILLLLWINRSVLLQKSFNDFVIPRPKLFKELNPLTLLAKIVAILFICYLAFFYIYLDPNPKSIFNSWDAVVSWNRWAVNWFQNVEPGDTREYPQLLPFNVSLTYQFLGTSVVQVFGRFIFYVFPIAMIACLWDLGKTQKDNGYFWAIPFLVMFLICLFGILGVSGYADIPVATMALLSLYPLLFSEQQESKQVVIKSIIIGSIICAGTAATKQSGIFLAITYPFLIYFIVLQKNRFITWDSKFKLCFYMFLLIVCYLAPWYIHKSIQFHKGVDSSIAPYLLSGAAYDVPAETFSARIAFAISNLFQYLNKYFVFIAMPLLILTGCFTRKIRILFVFLVIPMTLGWLLYFSYDLRNVAFAIPFLSITLGFGLDGIIRFCSPIFLYKRNLTILAFSFCFVITTLFLINKKYDSQRIVNSQISLQKQLGNAAVNKLIYSYFSDHTPDGMILTNNIFLEHLPVLKDYYVYEGFSSLENFLKNIQHSNGRYFFILEQNVSNKLISTMEVERYLDEHEGKEFHKIFHEGKYLFYKALKNT